MVPSAKSLCLLCVLLLFACPAWAYVTPVDYTRTLQTAGTITDAGAVYDFVWAGDAIVSIQGSTLLTTLVADPYAPEPTTVFDLGRTSVITTFTMSGETLYASVESGRIIAVDLSDPVHPQVLRESRQDYLVEEMVVAGGFLVLRDSADDLTILNAENFDSLGNWAGSIAVNQMVGAGVSGQPETCHVYLATRKGLLILSLADPGVPVLSATYTEGFPATVYPDSIPEYRRMDLDGTTLVVAGRQWDLVYDPTYLEWIPRFVECLFALDLQEPTSPTYAGWAQHYAVRLDLRGTICVTSNATACTLFDTSDWTISAGFIAGASVQAAGIAGDRIALSLGSGGVALYDATYPTQVYPVASYGEGFDHLGGSAIVDLATLGKWGTLDYDLEWRLYRLDDPLAPVIVASGHLGESATGAVPYVHLEACRGDFAVVSVTYESDTYFSIYNTSTNPATKGSGNIYGNALRMTGTALWVLDHNFLTGVYSLKAIDYAAFPSLSMVSQTEIPTCTKFFVTDQRSFLYDDYNQVLYGADLTDALHPQLGAPLALEAYNCAALLNEKFLLGHATRMTVLDLSDLSSPTVVGSLSTGFAVRNILADGTNAVLVTSNGFMMVDLIDPSAPVPLSSLIPATGAFGAARIISTTLYLSCGKGGIAAYDISQPAMPKRLGGTYGGATASVHINPDFGCLIHAGSIYPLHDDGGLGPVASVGGAATPRGPLVHISPNPFNAATILDFTLTATSQTRLAVYDLAGRLVTTLADRLYTAGDYRISWDGRDALGQPLASGTYIIELRSDSERSCRKALLVK